MVCGWMAWSSLSVLVVECVVGKFSLPEDGLLLFCFFVFLHSIMAGFGIHFSCLPGDGGEEITPVINSRMLS